MLYNYTLSTSQFRLYPHFNCSVWLEATELDFTINAEISIFIIILGVLQRSGKKERAVSKHVLI